MGAGKPGDAALALRERLAPVAASMGARVPMPEGESSGARIAPKVNLSWSIGRRMGRELGQLVSNCGIFRMGERIVTVDDLTGRVQTMTSRRLGSWLEQWVETVKMDRYGEERPTTMGEQLAKQVLESDQFRYALKELQGVHPVRMPVLRDGGKRPELLKPGYDEATGIFTCHSVPYDTGMDIEEARGVFFELLKSYPFADLGGDGRGFWNNRSVAVQAVMMLGNFCRGFFPRGVLRPMALIIGNQPGTGKGTLAQMQLAPVWWMPHLGRKPKDDAEFEKRLDTAALVFAPYLILDDIGGGLFSNALNAWLTEPVHSGRLFKTQEEFEAANVTQVIATGNQIKLTRDLDRRSLIVELHLAGEVEGRNFDKVIDPLYLASHSTRARILSAMWSMVRHWGEVGGCVRADNVKPSFEAWSSVMGGLTRAAGFADPLEKPDLGVGGDEETSVWKEFLARLAGEGIMPGEGSRDFTVAQMLDQAKAWEAEENSSFSLDDLVGNAKDQNKAFGKAITKWKGREIVDTVGRKIQFGKYREGRRRVYSCEVIGEVTVLSPK